MRMRVMAAAVLAAGALGGMALASPTCTSYDNIGSSGSGIVLASSLTAGECIQSADKIYGNFNLGSLPKDTALIFNMNSIGSLAHQQLSFSSTYATGTTYNWGYEVMINSSVATSGTIITSLDADFTQTAGGPSTLDKSSDPMGSGNIHEVKIGPIVQPGSNLMTTYGPGVMDLIISEQLADAGTISSVTNTVTEFVPGHGPGIPEPASLALLGAGLACFGIGRRRQRSK